MSTGSGILQSILNSNPTYDTGGSIARPLFRQGGIFEKYSERLVRLQVRRDERKKMASEERRKERVRFTRILVARRLAHDYPMVDNTPVDTERPLKRKGCVSIYEEAPPLAKLCLLSPASISQVCCSAPAIPPVVYNPSIGAPLPVAGSRRGRARTKVRFESLSQRVHRLQAARSRRYRQSKAKKTKIVRACHAPTSVTYARICAHGEAFDEYECGERYSGTKRKRVSYGLRRMNPEEYHAPPSSKRCIAPSHAEIRCAWILPPQIEIDAPASAVQYKQANVSETASVDSMSQDLLPDPNTLSFRCQSSQMASHALFPDPNIPVSLPIMDRSVPYNSPISDSSHFLDLNMCDVPSASFMQHDLDVDLSMTSALDVAPSLVEDHSIPIDTDTTLVDDTKTYPDVHYEQMSPKTVQVDTCEPIEQPFDFGSTFSFSCEPYLAEAEDFLTKMFRTLEIPLDHKETAPSFNVSPVAGQRTTEAFYGFCDVDSFGVPADYNETSLTGCEDVVLQDTNYFDKPGVLSRGETSDVVPPAHTVVVQPPDFEIRVGPGTVHPSDSDDVLADLVTCTSELSIQPRLVCNSELDVPESDGISIPRSPTKAERRPVETSLDIDALSRYLDDCIFADESSGDRGAAHHFYLEPDQQAVRDEVKDKKSSDGTSDEGGMRSHSLTKQETLLMKNSELGRTGQHREEGRISSYPEFTTENRSGERDEGICMAALALVPLLGRPDVDPGLYDAFDDLNVPPGLMDMIGFGSRARCDIVSRRESDDDGGRMRDDSVELSRLFWSLRMS